MNISATLSVFKLLRDPSLCLPHSTISTFQHLPIPLSGAFRSRKADIRAVVLDKDNCFAIPHANTVHKAYQDTFQRLRAEYPGARLLIVSNSAGTDDDGGAKAAALLEQNTGVTVLRHSTKKPGIHPQIMQHFLAHPDSGVTHPSHVAIVGDRLFTDVMMGNMMGSWSVWVRDGVVPSKGMLPRLEGHLADFLTRRGYQPQIPGTGGPFE
ncbi:MAG: hypothetical protein M1838_004650 [Thelocarpon superellum]|nr:MAG: hypothetical protein M1838_004650 [Thelocarpon superellum]